MKHSLALNTLALFVLLKVASPLKAQLTAINYDDTKEGKIVFHDVKTDLKGNIIPWYSSNLGKSFDFLIQSTWNFWDTMKVDLNGLPYYMNHQVWRNKTNDPRGLGGDQLQMAMSSWQLLYMYTGNERVKENMKFLADYYLTHSLSAPTAVWPNIPYPYNSLLYSGYYDGDMVIGKNFTQPDKAGSLAWELLKLYKICGASGFPHATEKVYMEHAALIANTLAKHTKVGDYDNSPLPFKVNAVTGEVGTITKWLEGGIKGTAKSSYTANWTATLQVFQELIKRKEGNVEAYQKAFDTILSWMKKYPLKNNRWGPFFEDIPVWSDTQINAITFAKFMMENPQLFPQWKTEVKGIFDWVHKNLGDKAWIKYGVEVICEQTAYKVPGNSHTARQSATELMYCKLSGDTTLKQNAIRGLSWATYSVDHDGKNNYPRDEIWLTDGYGDFIRHYINAFAALPELAPDYANHILQSTSVLTQVDYALDINKRLAQDTDNDQLKTIKIFYRSHDEKSTEVIRLTQKPTKVLVSNLEIKETKDPNQDGWSWKPMTVGGMLQIKHTGTDVKIF